VQDFLRSALACYVFLGVKYTELKKLTLYVVSCPSGFRFWENGIEQYELTCNLEMDLNAEYLNTLLINAVTTYTSHTIAEIGQRFI
jgi:hypothetical protein